MLRFMQPAEDYERRGSAADTHIPGEPGRRSQRASKRRLKQAAARFADLTITGANTSLVSGATLVGTAGAALDIGQPVYFDTASSTWLLADADAAGKDAATGITLGKAYAAGQPIVIASNQASLPTIGFGAILTAGETYIVSATAGKIAPITDAATSWKVCILGIAVTTSNLKCVFFAGSTAHA